MTETIIAIGIIVVLILGSIFCKLAIKKIKDNEKLTN